MDGIILINKPSGITSYDVIRVAKKVFKTKKIGHTGTLDPFASGLLILCIGKATKLANQFIDYDKEYLATIKFNDHYDTYDTTGTILNSDNKLINDDEFSKVLSSFKGSYLQKPPIYSAIKKDGKKLYEYARKNEEVQIDKRLVNIYNIDLLRKVNQNEYIFKTNVSKGTYIRSLAVDIAAELNTYAALSGLIRTKIGAFKIEDSITLNDLSTNDLITLEQYFKDYPKVKLSAYLINLVKNGIYLDERQTTINKDFIVVDENDKMIAYYTVIDDNKYKPVIFL